MTPIQIESQNPVLKMPFSHRTGKNGDICLHTGPLEGQNVLEFIGKHLAQPGPAVQFQENGFLYCILTQYLIESPLPDNTNFEKKMSISFIFQKALGFSFP